MSDHTECSGNHEHHPERILLELTPTGLSLNVLGVVTEVQRLLTVNDVPTALEVLETASQMLMAAYIGEYKALDSSYENAVVDRFHQQLEATDVLSELDGDRGKE